MRLDGCNAFVYYGGIIDIVFLVVVIGAVSAKWYNVWQNRKSSQNVHVHHVGTSPSNEAIPDASIGVELQSHNAPIFKPHQPSGVALPNTEGSFLHLCSMLDCSPPFNL
jgi:hypothetical protein